MTLAWLVLIPVKSERSIFEVTVIAVKVLFKSFYSSSRFFKFYLSKIVFCAKP